MRIVHDYLMKNISRNWNTIMFVLYFMVSPAHVYSTSLFKLSCFSDLFCSAEYLRYVLRLLVSFHSLLTTINFPCSSVVRVILQIERIWVQCMCIVRAPIIYFSTSLLCICGAYIIAKKS